MPFIEKEPGQLKRVHVTDLLDRATTAPTVVPVMIDSLDGNFRKYVEEKMAARYAVYMKKTETSQGTEKTILARSDEAKKAAIQFGLMEVAGLYTYKHIVRETASLISLGSEYEYTGEGSPESRSEYGGELQDARELGKRDLAMSRVDSLSVATGSSCALVQILGNKLNYQAIPRHKIWIIFADEIEEGGEMRPVDDLQIEEATVIIVQLSAPPKDGKFKYVAYYGRSDENTQGRMVTYWANSWHDVPDKTDAGDDASDFEHDGKIANPMTVWQDQSGSDIVTPEYPIVIWTGSTDGYGEEILPVSTGLYEQTLELDLGSSRVMMSAIKSARGVFALSRDVDSSDVMPETVDEGPVVLEMGQTLGTHSIPGINIKEAMAVLQNMVASTSEGFQVPAYRLGINASSVAAMSAAAIRELNRPLIRLRSDRITLNTQEVSRLYDIERVLASMTNGEATGEGIDETWIPNEIDFTQSRLDLLTEKEKELALKITDVHNVVQDVYPELDTSEKAEAYLEELTERAPEPVAPAAPTGISRLGRAPV
jgi:hypothetical protein